MPALYASAVIALGDMYLTQPVLPLLSHEFGVSPATAGLTVSAVVLFVAAASLLIGPLSDRFGRKPVMVWSVAALCAPTLLCALAPSFRALLVFRALQGACIPGLTAVAVAYLGELVEPAALGSVVGGWIAATVSGGLIGRVTSGLLADFFGWRAAFWVFAGLTAGMAALLFVALPADAEHRGTGLRSAFAGMLAHLRNRALAGAFLIGGALFFGFIGLYTYLPYYLTAAPFKLPPGLVAFAYLSYAAGVLVSPFAGRLSSRVPRRTLIAIGLMITALGMALTLIPSLPLIVTSLFVVCAGMFTSQAIAPALVNATAREAKGSASALYLMAYYFGGALGGALPGLAWQAWGWFGVIGCCLGAVAVAFAANWLLCRE